MEQPPFGYISGPPKKKKVNVGCIVGAVIVGVLGLGVLGFVGMILAYAMLHNPPRNYDAGPAIGAEP